MDLDVLRKVGFTDGEIRVYEALLVLGRSSSGDIMKKSGISSSKVYLILDKLIQKGLVSFIIEENVKMFQATSPKSMLDYVDSKKDELSESRKELEKVIPKINKVLGSVEEESAQVYKGIKGFDTAYRKLFDEFKRGEEYYIFSIHLPEIMDEELVNYLRNFHEKRVAKGIRVKVLADSEVYEIYKKTNFFRSLYSLRRANLTLPESVAIGKNRIITGIFGGDAFVYEVVSKRIAKRYREHFEALWNKAKK